MPSYISHAIMGEQVYQCACKENLFEIAIPKNELKGYSLGVDLAYLSKKTTSDPHNCHTKEFFLSMIKYIKDNRLIENSHIMALLYGHMAHYFLDTNTHPFIYSLEYSCQNIGIITSHNLVEGYLSSYLSERILGKNIMEIKPDYFNDINLSDEEISKLLNSIYGKIYGDYDIIKAYKRLIFIFSMLEKIVKNKLITKKFLIYFSQFNLFLIKNNLIPSDLTNDNHHLFINPFNGEKHYESFIELYNKGVELSLEAIMEVNRYLYSDTSIDKLDSIFEDLSYDTGTSCSKGRKLIYIKK